MALKNQTKPVGTVLSSILFSVYTRLILCAWLLFTDPLSVTFRYLIVIVFCLPLLRYCYHRTTGTAMEGPFSGSSKGRTTMHVVLFLAIAVIYLFAIPHVFSVYHLSFLQYLLVVVLPVVAAYALIRDIQKRAYYQITNEHILLFTISFYALPFLAGINYAFDFSKPDTKQYYVTGTDEHSFIDYSEPEHEEYTFYYLHLLPVDSIITPLRWMEVSETVYKGVHAGRSSEDNTIDSIRYLVTDAGRRLVSVRATSPGGYNGVAPTYFLQVLQTNAATTRTQFKYRDYKRYTKGDYLYAEDHRGLLGFSWRCYR